MIPFNDAEAARAVIAAAGDRCAGVLFDPMPSRVGMPAIEQASSSRRSSRRRERSERS